MLEFLQALTYVWYYVDNLRVRELAKFLVRSRLEAWFLLERVLHFGVGQLLRVRLYSPIRC